jgi:hypothetical protein
VGWVHDRDRRYGECVRYVRVVADEGGRSRFEDAELPAEPGHTVEGVPPLLLSGPFPVSEVIFVEVPTETPDWEPHVAPRRLWVIVLSGRAAITVSDGERREFGTGDVLLMEDTSGEGHLSTPLAGPLTYAMIPTGD